MKEINEEWQMRIFDLLEGNLSEKERQEILKQISANHVLKQEYDLMKQTYLQPEPLLFDRKSALYKKEGGALTFIFSRRFAAAAAVVLVFGTVAILWNISRESEKHQPVISKQEDNSRPIQSIPNNQDTSAPIQNKTTVFPGLNTGNTPKIEKPQISYAPVHIGDPEIVVNPNPGNKKIIDTATTVVVIPPLQVFPNPPNSTDTAITVDLNVPQQPATYRKKRSLGYKLLNGGRTMLANLQLPDVKFRTEKKTHHIIPRVKMEISTPNTEIIATLID